MLFFFHLFTGIILGFLIADLVHDRRWIVPLVIGAVIPDLIDKTIGFVLFPTIFGNGRIFMHSLLIFFTILVSGLIIWKRWSHPAILGVAIGILSHQILDLMWNVPSTWFFPLFGTFHFTHPGNYPVTVFTSDISSHSEWILAAIIAIIIILFFFFQRYQRLVFGFKKIWEWILGAGSIILFVLSGVAIGVGLIPVKGILTSSFRFFGWASQVEFLFGGIIFLLCSYLLWRMRLNLING
jgi:hypothetical protein